MENENEVKFYFGIITAMVAFVIITGGFILVMIRYQRKLLFKQRELMRLDAEHKQELLLSNIRSAEEQRKQIARDVHDEIGSIFSTLSLSVNRFSTGDPQQVAHIETSKSLIQSGINSVRRISHAIVPMELELLGLEQTLENHFETMRSLTGMVIVFDNSASIDRFREEAALAVYRIIQELCSNCVKHAGATELSVIISEDARGIRIAYKDNGRGSGTTERSAGKGIGLRNIESRVLLLNGTSAFVSEHGAGFGCDIMIPFHNNMSV